MRFSDAVVRKLCVSTYSISGVFEHKKTIFIALLSDHWFVSFENRSKAKVFLSQTDDLRYKLLGRNYEKPVNYSHMEKISFLLNDLSYIFVSKKYTGQFLLPLIEQKKGKVLLHFVGQIFLDLLMYQYIFK